VVQTLARWVKDMPVSPNAVVAKTGTVNPAIALAGVINTGKGLIYFAYLMKPMALEITIELAI
jgi:D-alanyl-D-alanine carboxypeptidase